MIIPSHLTKKVKGRRQVLDFRWYGSFLECFHKYIGEVGFVQTKERKCNHDVLEYHFEDTGKELWFNFTYNPNPSYFIVCCMSHDREDLHFLRKYYIHLDDSASKTLSKESREQLPAILEQVLGLIRESYQSLGYR